MPFMKDRASFLLSNTLSSTTEKMFKTIMQHFPNDKKHYEMHSIYI